VAQVNERFDQPGAIGPGFDPGAAYELKSFEDVPAQQTSTSQQPFSRMSANRLLREPQGVSCRSRVFAVTMALHL
jgi:hypothetical protein